ncbi:hypothetical protein IFM89_036279 [Coptis chinensis]|uniref:KIB1-4 beta-propeller domain-containing protein n=1 Tax=Coptis chinensis TaxID=261450 RepID=A0A835IIU2_9MAGN|nr:hypothetical protein IFM89_036279 [Coptis chinensis]
MSSSSRLKRDWSGLQEDLLIEISKHIHTRFESIKFRSVCQSWRSSAALPKPPFKPIILPRPIVTGYGSKYSRPHLCKLVESTIYTIRPKDQNQAHPPKCWIIKVEEDTPNVIHLMDPLSRNFMSPKPKTFPKGLNVLDFNIYGICKEYLLVSVKDSLTQKGYQSKGIYLRTMILGIQKVVVSSVASNNDFVIMALRSLNLIFIRPGNETWTNFDIAGETGCISDIVHYMGKFVVVCNSGRGFLIDPCTLSVTLLVDRAGYGGTKRLVESNGHLFLVEIFSNVSPWRHGTGGQFLPIVCEVFRLFEGKEQWVQVDSLADSVFLVCPECSFSVSAFDFPGCKGNCILLKDYNFVTLDKDDAFDRNIGVFNLIDGTFEAADSSYLQLFWPPPTWISAPK